MDLAQSYRKIFCEYQKFTEDDADRREAERLEKVLDSLNAESQELEKEILEQRQTAQLGISREERQREELHAMQTKVEQEEEKQEKLWKVRCRELGFSEEAVREFADQDFRTQEEIIQGLDEKLEKIEKIIAGYITQEKKQMDNITAIIDDPGGR